LRYYTSESKAADGTIVKTPAVVFNPVTKVAASGPKAAKGTRKGHNFVNAPDGTKMSLTKFVMTTATDTEKATAEFKYPHTRVDSRPKFDEYVKSHNLAGYTYEMPGDKPAETPAA
jgi:hypothetical protein